MNRKPSQNGVEAIGIMKEHDKENIPDKNGEGIIGTLSEGDLLNKILTHPEIKEQKVESVMEKEYPLVAFDTPVEKLSKLISKQSGAVLGKDETGEYHIVTKYDIIQSLAK